MSMSPTTAVAPTSLPRNRPTSDGSASNPRKRGRTACTRCKNRKQKCDDQWPVCSNCAKAGAECDKTAVTEDEPPAAYTRALEERIAFLESRLTEADNQSRNLSVRTATKDGHQHGHGNGHSQKNGNALGEIVDVLSMGNFEAPAYIGNSSGLSLALNLGEMVQATVWNKALPMNGEDGGGGPAKKRARRESVDNGGGTSSSRPITMEQLVANSADPPSDAMGRLILEAYFNQLHPRYPFLDKHEVWRLHCERATLATTPAAQVTKQQRFGIFKLYMVYAIGAMLLRLTDHPNNSNDKKSSHNHHHHQHQTTSPPESFYMTALQHIFAARESRTTQNIEAMTLLVIYHLRSLSSFGIWYMIGLAMRTSIDLGLHRRGQEANLEPHAVQMRRRLFWSVYSLERTIAVSMGRPFSLPERQIDVDLPVDEPEDGGDEEEHDDAPLGKRNALTTAIHLIKLRRIESRISHSIYRVDKPLSSLAPKLDRFHADLEAWRRSLNAHLSGPDLNYPMLHYHRCVRLLVQPFLALLPPTDAYYAMCMRAAGAVCQQHKKLHQSLDYGHSFIAVQTVFVCGITLLYGLWTQLHAIWSVGLADDIRACSLVLFVMGERASWVRKYRDAYELLVNATMDKLQGAAEGGGEGMARLAETAAQQQYQQQQFHPGSNDAAWAQSGAATAAAASIGGGGQNHEFMGQTAETATGAATTTVEDQDAWKVVAELASWIDQDEGSPVWMPDFEMLQNLS